MRNEVSVISVWRTAAIHMSALAIFALCAAGSAQAQSAVCLRLVNELAAIDSGGGFASASPQYRQYQRAVQDQRVQIAKTERAARRNGCGGFGFFRRNTSICSRISSSLDQMHANLRDLERNLANLSRSQGGVDQARRQAVLRDIQHFGCRVRDRGEDRIASAESPRRPRSVLEQIFGVRTYREDGFRQGTAVDPDTGLAERYGTYRTLCVRSCDGYYFPISFSTVPQRFGDDEQTCQSMCPGSDVELYYHRMPTQDSEDMMSVRADIPYADLPNAFDYREKFNPECSCRMQNGIREIAGGVEYVTEEVARVETQPRMPAPSFASDRALDPEALANSGGLLTADALDSLKPKPELVAQESRDPSGKSVRIVGPAFFPVQ